MELSNLKFSLMIN